MLICYCITDGRKDIISCDYHHAHRETLPLLWANAKAIPPDSPWTAGHQKRFSADLQGENVMLPVGCYPGLVWTGARVATVQRHVVSPQSEDAKPTADFSQARVWSDVPA